jgi:probable F420-dependent oxidoreductase
MEVGFGLITCQLFPGDDRGWPELYQQAIELSALADRVGLDSVWTSEHHFVDDGYMPSLLAVSAAIAAATERISIGTGVLLAPLHDPIRLAEDAATVDLLSEGRLLLGLGLGWSDVEFEALGIPKRHRGKAMDEILAILRRAWSGEPLEHHGAVYDLPEVAIRPTPTGGDIPIWIGGGAEAALRRAGRAADGLLSNAPGSRFAEQVAVITDERSPDAGPFTFAHYEVVYLCDDPAEGWETVAPLYFHSRWKYADMEASAWRGSGPVPAAPPPDDPEALRSRALVGPADMVAERILVTQEVAGVPLHFVARSYFPGLAPEAQEEQVHRLGEELKPLLVGGSGS